MSIALGNFNEAHAPVRRVQEDGNFRMLLLICGLVAAPALALALLLGGWVQYLLFAVAATNIAVVVIAYIASLNPPRLGPDEDPPAP